MSSYQEVVEKLLKSIGKIDFQEEAKKLEIKKWCRSYWEWIKDSKEEFFNFVADVLKEEKNWEQNPPFGGDQPVKLDIKKVFKTLSDTASEVNGKKNPFHCNCRYEIACWGCLEDDIKRIFKEEILEEYSVYEYKEDYEEKLYSHVVGWFSSSLARFWTHFIYKDHPLIGEKIKKKFSEDGYSQFKDLAKKYRDLGEEKYFAIGFEHAVEEGKYDAMKFFIDKIPESHRKDMIVSAATMQNANIVAINFCLNELGLDDCKNLLMESYEKTKKYLGMLNNLVSKHSFEEAKFLLKSWGYLVSEKIKIPEQLSEDFNKSADLLYDAYSSFIYGMLDEMTMPKHAALFEETDDFVYEILSDPALKVYKDLFIINTSAKQSTPCRDKMATLLRRDKESKAVFLILESANKEQRESIISSAEFSLLPYFLSDLEPELREKLESYGVAEPDYNKSTESLEHSMSASTTESKAGSPTASHSSEKSVYSPNDDLVKSKDFGDY